MYIVYNESNQIDLPGTIGLIMRINTIRKPFVRESIMYADLISNQ